MEHFDGNFANTEIESTDCYQSALSIFKNDVLNAVDTLDCCANQVHNINHLEKSQIDLIGKKNKIIAEAIQNNPELIEGAFKYYQARLLYVLQSDQVGIESRKYNQTDSKVLQFTDLITTTEHFNKAAYSCVAENGSIPDVAKKITKSFDYLPSFF